jgi:hypothetical protein
MTNLDTQKDWYENIDWQLLERRQLGAAGDLTRVSDTLQRIRLSFDFLIENLAKKNVRPQLERNLTLYLQRFQGLVGEIHSYTDVARRNEISEKIRKFEYDVQEKFAPTFSYFSMQDHWSRNKEKGSKDILNEQDIKDAVIAILAERKILGRQDIEDLVDTKLPKIPFTEEELRQIQAISEKLQGEREEIENALDISKKLIESNEHLVESTLELHATDARKKAREHKTLYIHFADNPIITRMPIVKEIFESIFGFLPYLRWISKIPILGGAFGWLGGSFLFGALALLMIDSFISSGVEASAGTAILRVSAIIIPSYFVLFCAQQYQSHKRLYEFYMFKDIAGQSMRSLRSQFGKNSVENREVLKKGLDVLFREPNLGDSEKKIDRLILREILELLKKNNGN